MSPVETSHFLHALPIPCVYFTADRTIAYANTIAHEVIADSIDSQNRKLEGCLLQHTNFTEVQLHNAAELNLAIDRLQDLERVGNAVGHTYLHGDNAERVVKAYGHGMHTIRLRSVHKAKRTASPGTVWTWSLSMTIVNTESFFCLIAEDAAMSTLAHEDVDTLQEDQWEMLQSIARPCYESPDHAIAVSARDMSRTAVNDIARFQNELFSDDLKSEPKMWKEDFTALQASSESMSAAALRIGKPIVKAISGIEDPTTGIRFVSESTVTVLNAPHSDQLLGCIVQMSSPKEWSEHLMQYHLVTKTTGNPLSASERVMMVRTMLLDGRLDYFSPSWSSFSQHELCDLCSDAWPGLVHPQDLPILQQFVQSSLAGGIRQECEVRYREGNSGEYYWFKDTISPYKDVNGTTTRWYCVSTDIHKLVSDRTAADLATQRLYSIVHDMDIALFEIDSDWSLKITDGAIVIRSLQGDDRTVTSYDGITFDEAMKLVHPEDVPNYVQKIKEVMDGVQIKHTVEYRVGPKNLQSILVPIRHGLAGTVQGAIKGVLGLAVDLSAQYAKERADIRLQTMEQSGRLKDEFLANVSHELRTPIAGILGSTDLLIETELNVMQLDLAQSLRSSAVGLLRLVNDLLDLSKIEANAMSIEQAPFKLTDLVNDAMKSYETLALSKGLHFDIRPMDDADIILVGDYLRIRQILHNLLSNAIKFTEAGFVRLSTTHEAANTGVAIKMIVQDSGIGISEETLARLFRPFEQADQSTTRIYGGTGLGLTIARKLATAMGGDVLLTSVVGRGTSSTFSVTLSRHSGPLEPSVSPLSSDSIPSVSEKVPPLSTTTLALDHCSVLVVEDNRINQKVITGHLRSLGLTQVSCAAHGGEAIDYIKAARLRGADTRSQSTNDASINAPRSPDIIFMDLQMPILDGFTTTRKLRAELLYDGPIIALTASVVKSYRQDCLDAGMNDYLTKPFVQSELQAVLQSWLPKT